MRQHMGRIHKEGAKEGRVTRGGHKPETLADKRRYYRAQATIREGVNNIPDLETKNRFIKAVARKASLKRRVLTLKTIIELKKSAMKKRK